MSEISTRPRPAATRVAKCASADGKAVSDGASASTAASEAPPPHTASTPNRNGYTLLNSHRFDPNSHLLEAEAAINAVESPTALHWAIVRLIEGAQPVVEAAERDAGSLQDASDRLDEVLAVIDAVEEHFDDQLCYGAGTLITLAKVQIDAKIERQAFAAANGGAA